MLNASDVALRLNLKKYPRSWRGTCPACNYAMTFSVRADRNGRPRFFCASCRDDDALGRVVAHALGQPRQEKVGGNRKDLAIVQQKQDAALRLWRGSEPAAGTLADTYLSRRGLVGLASSDALRFRPDASHPEGGRYPALVAAVTSVAGAVVGVHRTFLSRGGDKANADPAKASLGPIWGGAIRLAPVDPSTPLVIGEGVESAASAGLLMNMPAWAAISAGNLAKGLVLPPEARRVVIAADPDEPGWNAARDAWRRWTAEGREVRIATPNDSGDFNDLLLARETTHAE